MVFLLLGVSFPLVDCCYRVGEDFFAVQVLEGGMAINLNRPSILIVLSVLLKRWQPGQKKNVETLNMHFWFMGKIFISYKKIRYVDIQINEANGAWVLVFLKSEMYRQHIVTDPLLLTEGPIHSYAYPSSWLEDVSVVHKVNLVPLPFLFPR